MNVCKSRVEKGLYWDEAWSLVSGCTPISEGCQNCSGRLSTRFNGRIRLNRDFLDKPLKKKKPTVYAIWNDLFHEDVPFEFIARAWEVMNNANQHTFMVLTKRPKRMKEFLSRLGWYTHDRETNPAEAVLDEGGKYTLPNVWLGVTAENQQRAEERIPILLQLPAAKRFVSVEPMLGPVDLTEVGHVGPKLDWVICGSKSGPNRRPAKIEWIRSLRNQCIYFGVPFFLKQSRRGSEKWRFSGRFTRLSGRTQR